MSEQPGTGPRLAKDGDPPQWSGGFPPAPPSAAPTQPGPPPGWSGGAASPAAGQGYGQGYGGGYGGSPSGALENPPSAIAALILGIVGLTIVPLLASIAALVLGYSARAQARAEPFRYQTTLATIGIVLGWVGVVLTVAGVLFAVLAFGLLAVGSVAA